MMHWTVRTLDNRTVELSATESGRPVTWRHLLDSWQDGDGDRFGAVLADEGPEACYWECPPVTRATLSAPFECVLVQAPALASMRADPTPFEEQLRAPGDVAVFRNLGGDATLIAPGPVDGGYAHLLAFCRSAPRATQSALWHAVASVVEDNAGDQPHWLSTSGLGVAWLHVRWDQTPKYYQHAPYRDPGFSSAK